LDLTVADSAPRAPAPSRRTGSHLAASSLTVLHSAEGHPRLQCGGTTLALLYGIVLAFGALTLHASLGSLTRLGTAAA
jgi:hypothetical protein